MTGIERLRKLAGDFTHCRLWYVLISGTEDDWGCYRGDVRTVSDELLSIADQIELEREQEFAALFDARVGEEIDICELFGIEPGDDPLTALRRHIEGQGDTIENLRIELGECDVSAAWVREHGGIAYVKDAWNVRSNLDRQLEKAQSKVERQQRHIESLQGKLSEHRDKINVMRAQMADMRPRLMPEGCKWPRYESGELVGFGDEYVNAKGNVSTLRTIVIKDCRDRLGGGYYWKLGKGACAVMVKNGERVRRPAVPAGDGEPLEVGQTVWDTDAEADTPLTVVEVSSDLVRCEYTWKDGKTYRLCYQPDQLTHQRPDTWQRIEEDATLSPEVYCHRNGIDISQKDGTEIFLADTVEPMARDLVRRCRALAEKENRNE